MGATRKVVLELPEEDAVLLDELVASRPNRSAATVVGDALRLYSEGDDELENWLHNTVGPTVDAVRGNPAACLSGEQVLERLHALHARTAAAKP